jgi:hypothetical protein
MTSTTNMERKREQQEKRKEKKSHCSKDIFWAKNVWQLQASKTL